MQLECLLNKYNSVTQTKKSWECYYDLGKQWILWKLLWEIVHEDVIKWKHFPRYWPLVWGIHQSPVNSPHKSQWRGALMFSLICDLNKRFSKQSWGWRFETPSCSLWCHCNVICTNQILFKEAHLKMLLPTYYHVVMMSRNKVLGSISLKT